MSNFIGIERLSLGPWQAFERAIHRFFIHSGFEDCRLVGGSGDQGADVLGMKNNRLWVAQAKFRKASITIDESAVGEVVQAINNYNADEAVVVTNQSFSQGTIDASIRYSVDTGVPIRLWPGEILIDWSRKLPEYPLTTTHLRSYQQDAIEAVDLQRSRGRTRGLVIMAAGLGKTRVASELILREFTFERGAEVLVLAHTVPLVHQFETALWGVLPKAIPTHIWAGGEYPIFPGGVTCATMQTVIEAAKKENIAGRFSLVVVDEAHHAPADGYRQLLELLKPNFLLGLTATPWRSDEKLLSDIFGAPMFYMSITEGMQQGYLANVDYRMLVDDINWKEIPELTKQRLTIAELNRKLFLLDRDEAIVAKFCEHLEEMTNPRCMIFCRSKDHAESIYRLLRAEGKSCRLIHSGLDRIDSTNALREFRVGLTPTLIAVDMLNEGIDVPEVNIVIFLRVTHSRRIFVQQLGRGLRLREGKSTVRILDFVADIRRIAAGIQLNREAAEYADQAVKREAIRFPDGRIVKFSNDEALNFFDEYLKDIAQVDDLDENARLRFPPSITRRDD